MTKATGTGDATITVTDRYYLFNVSSANATVGDTYTNNSITWTVADTIVATSSTYQALLMTAAPGSAVSGTTLTRASGSGDATITFSTAQTCVTNESFTYAAGDTIGLQGDQCWYINTSPANRPGPISNVTATSRSIFAINNSSTTTPVVLSLNTENSDIGITYQSNKALVSGNWMVLQTGNGLVSQTLDFTALAGGVIDWPSAVWVEVPNQYWFTVSSSTAAVGDTYTNSGNTFTVMTAISSGTTLYCSNFTGDPAASGNLTRTSGAGTATIAYSAYTKVANTKYYPMTVAGVAGYWLPFFNIGNGTGANSAPDFDVQNIQLLTENYGDLHHGPVFKYDSTSKIATFGKGGAVASSLGGCVIPNGSRVIYPNIHLTSSVYNATFSSQNLFYMNGGASSYVSVCGFSNKFGPNSPFSGANNITWTSVCMSKIATGAFYGTGIFTNIACSPLHSLALASASTIFGCGSASGDSYMNYIFGYYKTTATYAPGITPTNMVSVRQFSNIFSWCNTTVTGGYAVLFESLLNNADAPITMGPWYVVGGTAYLRESDNIHIEGVWSSDQTTAVASTTLTNTVVSTIGCKNITVKTIRLLQGGAPSRTTMFSTDAAAYQIAFHDISYDAGNNASAIESLAGERIYMANAYAANLRSATTSGNTCRGKSRISNIYSNPTTTSPTLSAGTLHDWVMSSSGLYSSSTYFDCEPFNTIWTNTGKTTGRLCVGALSDDKNDTHMTTVSGVKGTDFWFSSSTNFYAPNTGVEVIWTNRWPTKGITDFSVGGGTATFTHTGFTTNAAIEFSLRINDGTDTSTWTTWRDATTYANWATSLSELTGYTSSAGFFARLRLTTSGASSSRVFQYGYVSATPDSAWVPAEIGFVPISVSGHVANSCIALYDNTVPASPVLVKKKIISTTATEIMDLPYNFDATAKAYKVVLRKAGYGEAIISDSSYQKGKSAPFSQVLYTSITDATAAAITGVTFNGATNTVTVTASNTFQDIHQYLQWAGAQVSNMGYNIPSTTTDNVNYSSSCNWVVNAGVAITGTFALTLTGGATLTMGAGATSTGNITHTSGTHVWTRIKLTNIVNNSRVQLYDSTASTELYNGVPGTSLEVQADWSTNHTIRYRVSYQSGTTAKNFIDSTGTFTSAGMSVQINQTDDLVYIANGKDGSLVTGITITAGSSTENINLVSGATNWPDIYAYQVYWQTTSTGIASETAFIDAPDTANYILTGFKIRNLSAVPLTITLGWAKDSVTGHVKDCIDSAGSTGNIFVEPDHVIPYGAYITGRRL